VLLESVFALFERANQNDNIENSPRLAWTRVWTLTYTNAIHLFERVDEICFGVFLSKQVIDLAYDKQF
jgi:hypothetical protein